MQKHTTSVPETVVDGHMTASGELPVREQPVMSDTPDVSYAHTSESSGSAMKFVLASYGSRGDIEPCVALGRELLRRGHEVRLAVPPDLVGFAEAAGVTAVAYGLETGPWLDAHRDFWTRFFRNVWKIRDLIRLWCDVSEPVAQCWKALVCAGWSDFSNVSHLEHVKVVGTVNFAANFPACRAVVHHGGAGTTAASLRAGVPTLIRWTWPDQSFWGAQLKRLKVGSAQRFSTVSQKSLVADLRRILAPQYVARAREIAPRMTKPTDSVTAAADLVENFARLRRVG